MKLYVIHCMFKPEQDSKEIQGLAICSDPNTVVSFIHADGSVYPGTDIWTYSLKHFQPWTEFNTN